MATSDDLDIARELAAGGVPVFVAPRCDPTRCDRRDHSPGEGHNGTGFHFPMAWEKTRADPKAIDEWHEGDGLAMVTGHLLDVLDKDVHHGGDLGWLELKNLGLIPRTYGVASTPSGGEHHLIMSLGVAKANEGNPARGVDLQAGAEGGTGRAFAFIAPTVKRSKITGELRPYHWIEPPRIEEAREFFGVDDSGDLLRFHVKAKRREDYEAEKAATAKGEVFVQPETLRSGEWTEEQAKTACTSKLNELRGVREGEGFNAALNSASMFLGHFVPEFWSEQRAREMLHYTILKSVNGWTSVSSQDERTITSGLTAGMREAYRRVEAIAERVEAAIEEPGRPTIKSMIMRRSQIRNLPRPEPLIEDVLMVNTDAWLIGAPGSGKSFVALDWACHVATGRSWRASKVRQSPVLLIAGEGTLDIEQRIEAWERTYEAVGDEFHVLPLAVQPLVRSGRDLIETPQWKELKEVVSEIKPLMIILDTQARMSNGLNENDNSEMSIWIEKAVSGLRRVSGACVLVIHHTGRNGGDARGASAIDGAQDTEWKVERIGSAKDMKIKLTLDKNKYGPDGTEVKASLQPVELGEDSDGRPITSLAVVHDPFDSVEVRQYDFTVNLSQNMQEVLYVLENVSLPDGDSQAAILRKVNELRRERGIDRAMSSSSLSSALTRDPGRGGIGGLLERGLAVRNGTKWCSQSRFKKWVAESDASRAQSEFE